MPARKRNTAKTRTKEPYCCGGSQRARSRLTSKPALTAAPGPPREKDNRIPQSLHFGMSGALVWGQAAMCARFSVCVLTAVVPMDQLPLCEQRYSCVREKPGNWGAIRFPIRSVATGCIDRWFAAYFRECALRFTREKAKVRSREVSKWNIVCRESQFGNEARAKPF